MLESIAVILLEIQAWILLAFNVTFVPMLVMSVLAVNTQRVITAKRSAKLFAVLVPTSGKKNCFGYSAFIHGWLRDVEKSLRLDTLPTIGCVISFSYRRGKWEFASVPGENALIYFCVIYAAQLVLTCLSCSRHSGEKSGKSGHTGTDYLDDYYSFDALANGVA